ncbi:PrsW family glutamic-type intramembrane protease [Streptococcus ovis]|uniref:PrsW family glutamic-type intramembrane protease n=1 Tax=Streptococcus ovis TaxID=82806 RepID=UPI000376C3A0|nr:PrsW family glutamic-type intramembrane protease [Streptococcus ovis]
MKKNRLFVITFMYLFLVCIGIEYEFSSYYNADFSGIEYAYLFVGVICLCLYLIPLTIVLLWGQKRWNLSPYLFPLAFVSGYFIAGWAAATSNNLLSLLFEQIFSPTFMKDWDAALTAPFTEEPLKLIAALFPLYFLKKKDMQSVIMSGAGAGLGFQLSEDIYYILTAVDDKPATGISESLVRISGALTSHWMMTAIVVLGFFLILHHQVRKGIIFIALVVFFHFVWNSPFSSLEIPFSLHLAFISALFITLFISILYQVDQHKTLSSH